MSQRMAIALCLVGIGCSGAPKNAVPPARVSAHETRVDRPPQDPSFEPPTGMRTYYIVLLRRGDNWTAEATPEALELGKGHMKYIERTAASGKLLVAGPFVGQTDAADYAGIYVYDVESLEAARDLVKGDPAVVAGRFKPEFLVWMAAVGLRVDPMPVAAPTAGKPSPCEQPEHRQFDFWIGTWTVRGPEGKVLGTNRIERAHRGCAVIENWRSAKGGTGISTNYWNPSTKKWVQNWVDGTGGIIRLEGELDGDAMRLEGTYVKADGTSSLLRVAWTPQKDGSVRQFFEQSKDRGKTWTTWFDGSYTPE